MCRMTDCVAGVDLPAGKPADNVPAFYKRRRRTFVLRYRRSKSSSASLPIFVNYSHARSTNGRCRMGSPRIHFGAAVVVAVVVVLGLVPVLAPSSAWAAPGSPPCRVAKVDDGAWE